MNSDCEKMKDLIADLVTGILSEDQMQKIKLHLKECTACRDYARALQNEDVLLTEFVEKIDTDMTHRQERLLQAIDDSYPSKQIDTPSIWRTIMKSPITKFAAAVVIIIVITLGLFEFIDTGSQSGVVWAEVIKNVETSPGVIFRIKETGKGDLNEQWPNGYRVMQRNATLSRMDWYRGDQIHRTVYLDLVGKTKIWVAHDVGVYSKETMSDESIEKVRGNEGGWTNPQALINFCLTHALERKELGQKMIDGVLCEGMEGKAGSDDSNPPAKSFVGRLWVSVETGFPVRLEIEAIGEDGSIRETSTIDQFQWNADLLPENVELEIPADYEPLK